MMVTTIIHCSTCEGGNWKFVSKGSCPAECAAVGDPHYVTFDGAYYTFNGDCWYRLVRETNMQLFDVLAENVPCGSSGVTCVKSVRIEAYGKIFYLMHGDTIKVVPLIYQVL